MKRAIILDYSDGTINILPIPKDTPQSRECEYVESHPCYDSATMSYMVVGEVAEVFEISTEETAHLENGIVCYETKPVYDLVGTI